MKAIVLDGELKLENDYPVPSVPVGEALVHVLRAGICNTDLEVIKGYKGYRGVLGHEFVGIVENGEWQGVRVVGEINTSDGTCSACLRGDATHCENRTTLGLIHRDGAMAEYLTLPLHNLHRVPDGITDVQAVFVEPLAAACEITDRLHIRPSDRVCVIGDGKLGLLSAQVLRLTGCDLLAIGRHSFKLDILRRRGIDTTIDPDAARGKFDVVVECTGNPQGFELARRRVRPRGTIVCKSTFHGVQDYAFASIVVDEISLVGSRCGPFAPALRLLEQKLVDVDSMLDSEFSFEQGIAAFGRAQQKGVLKVQIRMSQ